MADHLKAVQPNTETEKRIGYTTYIVSGQFTSAGNTHLGKIKCLLGKEIEKENA